MPRYGMQAVADDLAALDCNEMLRAGCFNGKPFNFEVDEGFEVEGVYEKG
jgi:hypothetical protein